MECFEEAPQVLVVTGSGILYKADGGWDGMGCCISMAFFLYYFDLPDTLSMA